MNQVENCNIYIEKYCPNFAKIEDTIFQYEEGGKVKKACIVQEKINELGDSVLFSLDFQLLLSEEERAVKADIYVFEFGGIVYYIEQDKILDSKLKVLRYIGNNISELQTKTNFVHLGVHGQNEILNGCQKYEFWCDKARYLGIKALGICEKNTLGGLLKFQKKCEKAGIKPIFGEEIVVEIQGDQKYNFKVFAKNKKGLKNIINISNIINLFSEGEFSIKEEDLFNFLEDMVVILPNNYPFKEEKIKIYQKYNCYYQIDTVVLLDNDTYYNYLNNIKFYLEEYSGEIPPILIGDSYYLEQEDKYFQGLVNKIAKETTFKIASESSHFKSIDEHFNIFSQFWKEKEDIFNGIFAEAVENTALVSEMCNCSIKMEKLHLPKAKIDGVKEEDNLAFLDELIRKGMDKYGFSGNTKYEERLKEEYETIVGADLENYFLILWDIVNHCKHINNYIGVGRGCLTFENKILTQGGYKYLGDFKEGDFVYNKFGILKEVEFFHEYSCKEEIVKLYPSMGSFQGISCTKDHIIYGQRAKYPKNLSYADCKKKRIKTIYPISQVIEEIPADKLEINDLIFTPFIKRDKEIKEDIEFDLLDYKNLYNKKNNKVFELQDNDIIQEYSLIEKVKYKYHKINKKIKLDEKFSYILGIFLGNGYFHEEETSLVFNNLTLRAVKSREYVEKICKELNIDYTLQIRKNTTVLTMRSFLLRCLFVYLFPKYSESFNEKGRRSSIYKEVPNIIWESSESIIRSFILGYIKSDGHEDYNKKRVYISSISLNNLEQIKILLSYLKIPSHIEIDLRIGDIREEYKNSKISYKINFPFVRKLGFEDDYLGTSINILEDNSGYLSRIYKKQKERFEGFVYDLTIEGEEHNYLTDAGLVHNSACGSLVTYLIGITKIDPFDYGLLFSRFLNAGRVAKVVYDFKFEDEEMTEKYKEIPKLKEI